MTNVPGAPEFTATLGNNAMMTHCELCLCAIRKYRRFTFGTGEYNLTTSITLLIFARNELE